MSPAPSWCTCGSQTHTAAVLLILQLICLEDLCASRAIYKLAKCYPVFLLPVSQWLGCIIGSQALLVFLFKKKGLTCPMIYLLIRRCCPFGICTSRHPKQRWTECSFRMPSSSSSESALSCRRSWHGYEEFMLMLLAKITIIITRIDLCSSDLRLNKISCISLVLQGCMDQIRWKHRDLQRKLAPVKILKVK